MKKNVCCLKNQSKKKYKYDEKKELFSKFYHLQDSEKSDFLKFYRDLFTSGNIYNPIIQLPSNNTWPGIPYGITYSGTVSLANTLGNFIIPTDFAYTSPFAISVKFTSILNNGTGDVCVGIGVRNSITGPVTQVTTDISTPSGTIGEYTAVGINVNTSLGIQLVLNTILGPGNFSTVNLPAAPSLNAILTLREDVAGYSLNVYDPTVPLLNNFNFIPYLQGGKMGGTIRSPFIYVGKTVSPSGSIINVTSTISVVSTPMTI
jgi:hypothetical protein